MKNKIQEKTERVQRIIEQRPELHQYTEGLQDGSKTYGEVLEDVVIALNDQLTKGPREKARIHLLN